MGDAMMITVTGFPTRTGFGTLAFAPLSFGHDGLINRWLITHKPCLVCALSRWRRGYPNANTRGGFGTRVAPRANGRVLTLPNGITALVF